MKGAPSAHLEPWALLDQKEAELHEARCRIALIEEEVAFLQYELEDMNK